MAEQALPCVKTPKGVEEVQLRTWQLPMRARQVLIMVDGKRDYAQLSAMFPGDGLAGILQALLDQGFIRPRPCEAPGDGTRPAVVAPADLGQRFEMARNFMANTISVFVGVSASSFIMRVETAADLEALRQLFQDWRETMLLSSEGRKQYFTLEEKLAALLS